MTNDLYSITTSKNIFEIYKNYQKRLYPDISDPELAERMLYASVWIASLLNKQNKEERANS